MATATKTKTTRVVETQVDTITLVLDKYEAAFLATLLAHVGGNPDETIRSYQDEITPALREAGAVWVKAPYRREGPGISAPMSGDVSCLIPVHEFKSRVDAQKA